MMNKNLILMAWLLAFVCQFIDFANLTNDVVITILICL